MLISAPLKVEAQQYWNQKPDLPSLESNALMCDWIEGI